MGPQNNCAYLPLKTERKLRCLCIEIIDKFYWLIWKTIKTREEGFLQLVGICFHSRDTSFQSLRNLEEKCEKENWAFSATLTKIVMSQVGLVFILKYLNLM